ncbi:MAG TPA: BNR-4 repeat-containing protein [Sedimentisphaerales bacterium]|nr:BNR-4 repeat-containing protein [Sedimentisphaerales bacterium]
MCFKTKMKWTEMWYSCHTLSQITRVLHPSCLSRRIVWATLLLLALPLALLTAGPMDGEDIIVLFDSGRFEDAGIYPLGDLQAVAHGQACWTPASGTARPGEIVALENDRFARALRRHQTAQNPTDADLLDFPRVAGTLLTISFDARVSTSDSRTLDVSLLRPGSTAPQDQASILIWGQDSGRLCYYDGNYRDIAKIDERWHHYELIHDLTANTFDLRIDGERVGKDLRGRNAFPSGATFGRLRIASIRGRQGEYADLTNLRITAAPAPPAIGITEPVHAGGLLDPDGKFRFQVTADSPVQASAIAVRLNDRDVTEHLAFEGTAREWHVSLGGLKPNTSYRAVITASNARGTTERIALFYTFRDKVDGYRGIWFTLGQMTGMYGDKISGGLAFMASHTLIPMAVYSPQVDKTFFVYGGTTGPENRYLLAMASYYDHKLHRVPRPTIVRDQRGVNDPHDNPSIAIDETGHVWVFVAGRSRGRPGQIFRSKQPYSVDAFEQIIEREQTYCQIWPIPGKGFFLLLTLYTKGRELYWETSSNGRTWTAEPAKDLRKLAGFGGHYQVSRLYGSKVGTAFNYHPGGSVDRRTNIYYAQTSDFGETWTTVDGRPLKTPLDHRDNPALVVDYEAKGRLFYITELLFDDEGRPVILGVSSGGYAPGPQNDPRTWEITRWTGNEWITRPAMNSDHNYDMGSLYLNGKTWTIIGPGLPGPQPYFTGGEVGLWVSTNQGESWELKRRVTQNSPFNHSYLRRPHNPVDPFFGMWADGDSSKFSISRLYFTNSTGDRVYMLPYTMEDEYAEPILVSQPLHR